MKIFACIIFFLSAILYSYAQHKVEIKTDKGVPALYINEEPYPPFVYMSYLGEKEYYKEMAKAGIHLYCFPAYLADRGINSVSGIGSFRKPIWKGKKQHDFSSIAEDLDKIIDPLAKMIIRLYLDAPLWWKQSHPDEACQLSNGINTQRTTAFRQWLSCTYQNDSQLQSAWDDGKVALQNAIPVYVESDRPSDRWKMEKKERRVVDSYKFQAENMVDNIAYFCKHIKEISQGQLLSDAFYGYHYFLADASTGHAALHQLLQYPHLDYQSSPNDYNRVVGEDWLPFTATRTIQQHGKLWLAENDIRASITTLFKEQAPAITPKGFYDSGVWLGPEDLDVISKTNELYINSLAQPLKPMQPQLAVVEDEDLCLCDNSLGQLTGKILSNRYSLGKVGTSYDLFLRPDGNQLSGQYKMIWLLGVFNLTREKQQRIEKWQEEGITIMWTNNETTRLFTQAGQQEEKKTGWSATELRKIYKDAGANRIRVLANNKTLLAGNNNYHFEITSNLPGVFDVVVSKGDQVLYNDIFTDPEALYKNGYAGYYSLDGNSKFDNFSLFVK